MMAIDGNEAQSTGDKLTKNQDLMGRDGKYPTGPLSESRGRCFSIGGPFLIVI